MARRDVISCDVTFASLRTRRKSIIHCAEGCFGNIASVVGESGEVGSVTVGVSSDTCAKGWDA